MCLILAFILCCVILATSKPSLIITQLHWIFDLKASTSFHDLWSLKKPLAGTDALGCKTRVFKSCKQTFWSSQFTPGVAVSVQTTISQRFCMQSITESNYVFLRWGSGKRVQACLLSRNQTFSVCLYPSDVFSPLSFSSSLLSFPLS